MSDCALSDDAAPRASDALSGRVRAWIAYGAIAAVAVAIQARGGLNLDVSWFMTFAERVLQGARAYVDVSDPNPPAAILIYMPAMALAAWTGFKAEALVVAQTLVMAFASVRLAGAAEPDQALRGRFRLAAFVALTILPGALFAEREHYAAMAALPAASVMIALGRGRQVAPWVRFAAGCAAGGVVAFKPHFGAALVIPALWASWRQRSLRWIGWPEIGGFTGVVLLYAGVAWFAFPAYFSIALPDALEVYGALHAPLSIAFASATTWFMLAIATAALVVVARADLSAGATGGALAAIGFVIACFAQQRYQANHASPVVELAAIALLEALAMNRFGSLFARAALAMLVVLAPLFMRVQILVSQTMGAPAVVAAARKLMPPDGRLGAIASSMELTFPAARQIGGLWINRYNSMWRTDTAEWMLANMHPDAAKAEQLRAVIASDRRQLVEDISRGRPDVLIVESRGIRERTTVVPAVADLLADFRRADIVDGVELWARKPGQIKP